MLNFNILLAKIKERLDIEQGKTEQVREIIKEYTGITITDNQIVIKKGVAIVSLPPTVKMAVFVKREIILAQCKERGIPIVSIV